jgi:hypothetical protein
MMPRVLDSDRLPYLREPTPEEDHLRAIRHAFAAVPWSAGGWWAPSLGAVGPAPGEWVETHALVESGGVLFVSAELRRRLRRVIRHVGPDSITYETSDGEEVTLAPYTGPPIARPDSIARPKSRREINAPHHQDT